eukprot:237022_1
MFASAMNMLGFESPEADKPEGTEWMKRYQQLTWMGFPEDETTLITAQKYTDVQACVEHLTKDEDDHIESDDTPSAFGIQSIVNSVFTMISNEAENASDDEKVDDTNDDDDDIRTEFLCKCGSHMILKDAATCYVDTQYLFVICDQCDQKCDENAKIYHCPRFKIDSHPEGYDICENCAFISIDKTTEIGDVHSENKQIEPHHDQNDDDQSVECMTTAKPPILKRALIIQTLPNEGTIACQDADALDKLFTSLGYEVIVITPNIVSRERINDELDNLYSSDHCQEGTQTFTVICYSGHAHIQNGNLIFERNLYSSEELYQRINVTTGVLPTLKDGFVRMITGNNQQNETLLIVNACHSGTLQRPLKEQEESKKSVSTWIQTKIPILLFFLVVGVLCYCLSKYDKKNETIDATENMAAQLMDSKKPNEPTQTPPKQREPIIEPEMKDNGMDNAQELMEREMDGSVDFDWNDLKRDIKSRWMKWKGKVPKRKFVQKYCSALLKHAPADGPDQMAVEPASVQSPSVEIEAKMQEFDQQAKAELAYVPPTVLHNPTSRHTWAYLARNMSDCAVEQVMKNTCYFGVIPGVSFLMSTGALLSSWMRSRNANRPHLVASTETDQESHFVGGVSPFVRYVINAIGKIEAQNGEILDVEQVYQSVAKDAEEQDLDCGMTLNGMGQDPVMHYTKY